MNRLSRLVFALALALAGAGPALAQGPAQTRSLRRTTRSWSIHRKVDPESDVKASPFGPAERTPERGSGIGARRFLSFSTMTSRTGAMKATGILGYDGGAKYYPTTEVDSSGNVNVGKGNVAGMPGRGTRKEGRRK